MSDTRSKAEALVNALLERDDIGKLPLPASAKRYARMTAADLGQNWSKKVQMYIDQVADTTGQTRRKKGFRNADGGRLTGESVASAKWLKRHGLQSVRELAIERDPTNDDWARIPVLDRQRLTWIMMKVVPNMETALKQKLQRLVLARKGYIPGDVFTSPWGRFMVDAAHGVKAV